MLELVGLEAVEELVEVELNLACLPEIGSEALQVNFHVVDLVYPREALVEVKKPDHCCVRLFELLCFLPQCLEALLGAVAPRPLLIDAFLSLLHLIHAILHLLLDNNEPSLQRHDIVAI